MRIKGTDISSLLNFLEVEYGPSRVRDFVLSLDANLKKRCEGLVLASAFYPVEELESLARAARRHFDGDETFYERSGAHNATFGLSGVHKSMLARPTPVDFLRAAERSWGQFMDEGVMETTLISEGRVRVKFEGIRGSDVRCARATGFLFRALELAGAKALTVQKAGCTETGHPVCEWDVAWDARLSPASMSQTTAIRRPGGI